MLCIYVNDSICCGQYWVIQMLKCPLKYAVSSKGILYIYVYIYINYMWYIYMYI